MVKTSISYNKSQNIAKGSRELICVHGLGTYSGWFTEAQSVLGLDGIAVSSFDLPGFGAKQAQEPTIEDWQKSLQENWAASDSQQKYLLGHSLGGLIVSTSLHLLDPKPAGVILTVPAFWGHPASYSTRRFIAPTLYKGFFRPDTQIDLPYPDEVMLSVKEGRHALSALRPQIKASLFVACLFHQLRAFLCLPSWRDIPLLLIVAGRDTVVSTTASRLFFSLCPSFDKRFLCYPAASHDLFVLPELELMLGEISEWIFRDSNY